MTEQDERTIYEWVGYYKPYKVEHGISIGWFSHYSLTDTEHRHIGIHPLPALDMNFAFDVCVPKLYVAGCTVIFKRSATDRDYRDGYWRILWGGYPERLDEACQHDFYSALLAYIKGVTLPTIDEFIGSDPAFTGSKSTKEYIEEMRS